MKDGLNKDRARQVLEAAHAIDLGATTRELMQETGFSRPTIIKYTDALVDRNALERHEKGNGNIYVPVADPSDDDWW